MIIRSLFILAGLFTLSNCSSQAVASQPLREVASAGDEIATREKVFNDVTKLIAANDFKALSDLAESYRTSRVRTTSGYWLLGLFHEQVHHYLIEGLTTEKGCEPAHPDFVTRWRAAFPNSPAPIIAEANMHVTRAWCHRGSGYADSVSPEAWSRFRENLQSAYEILETNKEVASIDPEYYAVQSIIYRGMSAPKDDFNNLLNEATKKEPAYHRTYTNAVEYHLPKWGGSWEEVESFLRMAAKKPEKTEGTSVYVRILWTLDACDCDIYREVGDWEMLQTSMRDLYQRFPNGRNREYFMKLSCKLNKPQAAYEFAQMGFPEKSRDELNAMTMQACSEAMAEQQQKATR